jgi:AraC-like DNA-binding protein/mannose-6-phosphate isomerase-like protein (cupin superfamily)
MSAIALLLAFLAVGSTRVAWSRQTSRPASGLANLAMMAAVRIRHAAQLVFPPDWRMPEHRHERFAELIIPIGGAIETRIGGECVVARPGCVMFYPAREPHAERSVSRQPVKMLYLALAGAAPPFVAYMRVLPDRRSEFLARWMLEAGEGPLRDKLLDLLVDHYHQTSGDAPMVAAVKTYVREHLHRPIALTDLAAEAGVSVFHFSRLFRDATGVSPMRYVRRQRVDAARTLLLTSPMPLKAVAPAVGFRDEFELSRVFKRETGQSPRQARG